MKKLRILGDRNDPVIKGLRAARNKSEEAKIFLDKYIEIHPWDGYSLSFQESNSDIEIIPADMCKEDILKTLANVTEAVKLKLTDINQEG